MDISSWKFYKRFYKGNGFRFVLTVFLSVLQSAAVVPIALMVRLVFDEAIPKGDGARLIKLCVLIMSLYVLNGGFSLWTRYLSLDITKKAIKKLRDEMV